MLYAVTHHEPIHEHNVATIHINPRYTTYRAAVYTIWMEVEVEVAKYTSKE